MTDTDPARRTSDDEFFDAASDLDRADQATPAADDSEDARFPDPQRTGPVSDREAAEADVLDQERFAPLDEQDDRD